MQDGRVRVDIDTETWLIQSGRQAPKLVCLSYVTSDGYKDVLDAYDAVRWFTQVLADNRYLINSHNAAFDTVVMLEAAYQHGVDLAPLLFYAYRNNRITCTLMRAQLADLGAGKLANSGMRANLPSESHLPAKKKSGYYTLAGCIYRAYKEDIGADKGDDAWRLRYCELDGLPFNSWPTDAYRYALHDAELHGKLYEYQREHTDPRFLRDEYNQARAAFAFRLMECHGVQTDAEEVDKLEASCKRVVEELETKLLANGLMRVEKGERKVIEKNLKEWVEQAYSNAKKTVPRTPKSDRFPNGQVKIDKETLKQVRNLYPSGSNPYELLAEIGDSQEAWDTLDKYIPLLKQGGTYPIHTRYRLILETGRTSSSPNVQNPPRAPLPCDRCGKKIKTGVSVCTCGGYIGNVRTCFVARPGKLLCSVDYNQLELCTLSQACIDLVGFSSMGDAINAGKDLHSIFAADLLSSDYETVRAKVKAKEQTAVDARQDSKICNFGLGGGMGPKTLVEHMAKHGRIITFPQAKRYIAQWLRRWHEMPRYFATIKALGFASMGATAAVELPRTGLVRGKAYYSAACNFKFQALAAAGAKAAGFDLAEECYAVRTSPLYGSRLSIFLHDEWMLEHPESSAHDAALRQAEIQRATMQTYCPNVVIPLPEPALMERWYKQAEARYENGRLVAWEP